MSKQGYIKEATECSEIPLNNVPHHIETKYCNTMKINWVVSTWHKSSLKVISEQTLI